MEISIANDPGELGRKAAGLVTEYLNKVLEKRGEARIVVSTGSSQFEMFRELVKTKTDWSRIEVFHLDEYINLAVTHRASFRKYLYERFINSVPVRKFHSVDVEGNIEERIKELSQEIREKQIDLGLIGIGENGHIAFNDPPADFETREAYIVVGLDDRCKMQQVNEGWFSKIEEVPDKAVSMSVWQIMQCRKIISVVPHKVKSDAVFKTLTSSLTPLVPATMLKLHPDWHLFLDKDSASGMVVF
jgi:glucosamine-6-phosphate deaminase